MVAQDKNETIVQTVSRLMRDRKKTLSTAESCTGGYIAHLITAETDASTFYKGTIVSYANEIKQEVLHVSPATLQVEGAVSEATVRQMVSGVIDLMKTDYAIAVSGIMGPGGGSEAKPVGTVWIAAGGKNDIRAWKFHFHSDRIGNIEMTADAALEMMRTYIAERDAAMKE
ncbi:MAG TPA: CinA family protein [Chitinophagaceae bacterium]|nr:CinA family protein [Chitinophagaceae bacterium]